MIPLLHPTASRTSGNSSCKEKASQIPLPPPQPTQQDELCLDYPPNRYLRLARGAINFTPPGFSSVGDAATICSSFNRFSDRGDAPSAVVVAASPLLGLARFKPLLLLFTVVVVVAVDPMAAPSGFFSVFLDGGGGISSTKPWFRNCELNVLTVFGRFSESFRTSIEIDDFLTGGAVAASSVFGFLGILPSLSRADPPITLLSVSLSLSACDTDDSLVDLLVPEELLLPDLEEEDEDLWELLLLRSLSLSRLLLLLLLPLLLLLLLLEDDDEEEEDL